MRETDDQKLANMIIERLDLSVDWHQEWPTESVQIFVGCEVLGFVLAALRPAQLEVGRRYYVRKGSKVGEGSGTFQVGTYVGPDPLNEGHFVLATEGLKVMWRGPMEYIERIEDIDGDFE